jgi:hypothetical protein
MGCTVYIPPYTYNEVVDNYGRELADKLYADPAHKFRMDTGIELIHREPTLDELERIYYNWGLMSKAQKRKSNKESKRLFGVTNEAHYSELRGTY